MGSLSKAIKYGFRSNLRAEQISNSSEKRSYTISFNAAVYEATFMGVFLRGLPFIRVIWSGRI